MHLRPTSKLGYLSFKCLCTHLLKKNVEQSLQSISKDEITNISRVYIWFNLLYFQVKNGDHIRICVAVCKCFCGYNIGCRGDAHLAALSEQKQEQQGHFRTLNTYIHTQYPQFIAESLFIFTHTYKRRGATVVKNVWSVGVNRGYNLLHDRRARLPLSDIHAVRGNTCNFFLII